MTEKIILIGRHNLLPKQESELKRIFGSIPVEQVQQVPNDPRELQKLVQQWINEGAKAIVIQALPLNMIATIHAVASRNNIPVVVARMEAIGIFPEEEAKKIIEEAKDRRTGIKAMTDKGPQVRVMEFKYWEKIKRITIETEPL